MSSTGHRTNHSLEGTVASLTNTFVEGASPSQAHFPGFETQQTTTDPTSTPQFQEKPAPIRRENTIDPHAVPPVIPPDHPGRTLVVCFDGTGDQFDSDNSNVIQFVSLLRKDDRTKQLVYYQVRSSRCLMEGVYILNIYMAGRYWDIYVSTGCFTVHVKRNEGMTLLTYSLTSVAGLCLS